MGGAKLRALHQQLLTTSPVWPCTQSQVIDGMDVEAHLETTTLHVNEGSSRCGIHHDPPAPLWALIAGPTNFTSTPSPKPAPTPTPTPTPSPASVDPPCLPPPPTPPSLGPSPPASPRPLRIIASRGQQSWKAVQKGGRLFVLDGLWDLSYGPLDLCFLDGRFAHGVSVLRDLPLQNRSGGSRSELHRYSAILFSKWQREKMKGEKRLRSGHMATWQPEWLAYVPWSDPLLPATGTNSDLLPAQRPRKACKRYGYSDSADE